MRTVPRSRTNPQYNADVLADELAPFQIGYARIAELGGLRGRSRTVPPETNGFWGNQSFHNYADYALSEEFGRGLDELLSVSADRRTAIMCAEAVWWRCHRRIIADYLIAAGEVVLHILGPGNGRHQYYILCPVHYRRRRRWRHLGQRSYVEFTLP